MTDRDIQFRLGVGAMVASALFIFIGVPALVSTPSNVPNVILSPLFWPYTVSGFVGLIGAGMLIAALRTAKADDVMTPDVDDRPMAYVRLLAVGVIMLVTVYAMPVIGLVWTAMFAFVATAFLVRTSHPISALITAILLPLVLYAFFAHLAGVAIPQGEFLRLP